jgi:hypothetical protein
MSIDFSSAIRALAIAAVVPAASAGHAAACAAAEYRAFDFWVGQWNVYGPKGRLAGTNNITKEYDGCVVHERYEGRGGYRGESLNTFDAGRKVWHQTWVDNSGLLLVIEGGLEEGKMVLRGQTTDKEGKVTRHRITWSRNADGSVRQLWESTDANGQWAVSFDGKYVRR